MLRGRAACAAGSVVGPAEGPIGYNEHEEVTRAAVRRNTIAKVPRVVRSATFREYHWRSLLDRRLP